MYSFINQEDIYNLIISRTPMALSRMLGANFKRKNIPITKEQFSILVVLWKKDGCSQDFLAKETYRDRPGVSRLLVNLEKEGLVFRKNSRRDKRSNEVYLTNKGRSLEQIVTQTVIETVKQATQNISEEEAKILKSLLEKIFNNLQ